MSFWKHNYGEISVIMGRSDLEREGCRVDKIKTK
jgi:hypothetical protein